MPRVIMVLIVLVLVLWPGVVAADGPSGYTSYSYSTLDLGGGMYSGSYTSFDAQGRGSFGSYSFSDLGGGMWSGSSTNLYPYSSYTSYRGSGNYYSSYTYSRPVRSRYYYSYGD